MTADILAYPQQRLGSLRPVLSSRLCLHSYSPFLSDPPRPTNATRQMGSGSSTGSVTPKVPSPLSVTVMTSAADSLKRLG